MSAQVPRRTERVFVTLTLLSTLSASLIWGVNTLFLLDAGLNNTEAFAANAFFTAGQVLFEVPTGVVADLRGRRTSYLAGVLTLFGATLLYLWMWHVRAPLFGFAVASVLLGLGFTFFSGATEAWLVDALTHEGCAERLEAVMAKGQVAGGVAMLVGSVAGGYVAQITNLGVPYVVRAGALAVTFVVALVAMHDLGFAPKRGAHPLRELQALLRASLTHGLGNPPVRWLMLAAPFGSGVGIYAFYAAQPHLLALWGDETAFGVAGLAAAAVAGAQIVGGLSVPALRRRFGRRSSLLLTAGLVGACALVMIGYASSFWLVAAGLVLWALTFAAAAPVRQALLNGLIPSQQRATVLSFDALMGSLGGVAAQPALGRAADLWGYGASYALSGAVQAAALPFLLALRRNAPAADREEPRGRA